jgi:hypothetical protein
VAKLLNRLLIEQTKSQPRQSGGNGLAETRNGAVIRKHIGWGYIDACHALQASDLQTLYRVSKDKHRIMEIFRR